jgi:outer membrane protein OmpA-like peptidoglycan-associated protein
MRTPFLAVVCALACAAPGRAQTPYTANAQEGCTPIDFEAVPGGAPKEGLLISEQYRASQGVTFALEGGGSPRLAEVGPPRTAFGGPPKDDAPDTAAPNQSIGRFFLTDDGIVANMKAPPLIVTYDPPTASASGVVLDIDFDETFDVEARGADGRVLHRLTIAAKEPGTGDGIATQWSVVREAADIHAIRFEGHRRARGGFGFAFDNFCARAATSGALLQISLDASVLFDSGTSQLKPAAQVVLRNAAPQFAQYPGATIRIEGHTDSLGDPALNQRLSLQRAEAVSEFLAALPELKGVALDSVGYGDRRPAADNATESGRQKNRRVEVRVVARPAN